MLVFMGGMYNMIVPIGNIIGMTNGWKIRYIKYINLPCSPINPLGNKSVFFSGVKFEAGQIFRVFPGLCISLTS